MGLLNINEPRKNNDGICQLQKVHRNYNEMCLYTDSSTINFENLCQQTTYR